MPGSQALYLLLLQRVRQLGAVQTGFWDTLVRACHRRLAAQGANLCVGKGGASRGANAAKHSPERKVKRLASRRHIRPVCEHGSLPEQHHLPALEGPTCLDFASRKSLRGKRHTARISLPWPFKNWMKCSWKVWGSGVLVLLCLLRTYELEGCGWHHCWCNFGITLASIFWRKPAIKGGIWRGSLHFSEAHLTKWWTPPERVIQLLIVMWLFFFSSEDASAVRELLQSILPQLRHKRHQKTDKSALSVILLLLAQLHVGLNHGSLSSGYCGSYGNVLREPVWQTAAQRGAPGASPECTWGPVGAGIPKHPCCQVLVQPLALKLKLMSGKGSVSFLVLFFSCCVCSWAVVSVIKHRPV